MHFGEHIVTKSDKLVTNPYIEVIYFMVGLSKVSSVLDIQFPKRNYIQKMKDFIIVIILGTLLYGIILSKQYTLPPHQKSRNSPKV